MHFESRATGPLFSTLSTAETTQNSQNTILTLTFN
jgi:hypothetical protein